MVAVAYNPKSTEFNIGDYVRTNGAYRGCITDIQGRDAQLGNGNWYFMGDKKHAGELTLLKKATAICDVCEESKPGVITEHMDIDGSLSICAGCRDADMVVTNEQLGNSEQLDYTRPAQALAANRLELVTPCTANGVKIADLVSEAENIHDVPERLFLPAPKSNEPQTPSQPSPPKIYEANYDGYQELVEDYFDYFKPTVYFVRDFERTYHTFFFDCIIIRDLALTNGNAPDIIPVTINDAGDKVEHMVLWDWTPIRKQASFGDCLTALLADGYRVIVAHGDKVMTYDATRTRKQPSKNFEQLERV